VAKILRKSDANILSWLLIFMGVILIVRGVFGISLAKPLSVSIGEFLCNSDSIVYDSKIDQVVLYSCPREEEITDYTMSYSFRFGQTRTYVYGMPKDACDRFFGGFSPASNEGVPACSINVFDPRLKREVFLKNSKCKVVDFGPSGLRVFCYNWGYTTYSEKGNLVVCDGHNIADEKEGIVNSRYCKVSGTIGAKIIITPLQNPSQDSGSNPSQDQTNQGNTNAGTSQKQSNIVLIGLGGLAIASGLLLRRGGRR
jgi:hypothetical protein